MLEVQSSIQFSVERSLTQQQTTNKNQRRDMVPESIKHKIVRLFVIYLTIAAALSFSFVTAAAEPKRIALLPFKINAEKDMTFLQNGIFDMLTSRLSKEGEVVVIGRQEAESAAEAMGGLAAVNESFARKIGSRLNANYTLFGSLTVLGDSISIDSKMVDVSGNTPTRSFFEQAQDLGGIITKINNIAVQINESVFGRQAEAASKTAPPAKVSESAPKDDTHAHPEKLLKGRGADSETGPMIMMGEQKEFQGFWRSPSFKFAISGIAMGDVDGDGKIETVVVTPHSVIVYRFDSGRFFKVYEPAEDNGNYYIGVDVADINGTGPAEIFVTSLNLQRTALTSFVLEYTGKDFAKIVKTARWYFRVADLSSRGEILLGQKHKYDNAFTDDIYEMIWQGNEYVPSNTIKVSGAINVLGLTLGDITNEAEEIAVAYDDADYLQLFDSRGEVLWKVAERFGGSTLYYQRPRDNLGGVTNPKYYPMRIVVRKNKAGKDSEIIAVKNHDIVYLKTQVFRKFTKTHIQSWIWDGLSLKPIWKTHQLSGFIRDFAVGDFNNDGQPVLIAALVISEGVTVLTDPKSRIIAYSLPD
jgi:TolB-like protein